MMRKPIQSTSKVSLEPTSYSVLQYHIVLCQGSASLGAVHPAAFHCLDDCAAAASPPRPSDLDPRTRSSQSEAHKVVQCDSCYTLLIFIVQFCPTLILIILMYLMRARQCAQSPQVLEAFSTSFDDLDGLWELALLTPWYVHWKLPLLLRMRSSCPLSCR